MRVVLRVAWVIVVGAALGACRGGVKSGVAVPSPGAVAMEPPVVPPVGTSRAPVTPTVYRIEYYKISDG